VTSLVVSAASLAVFASESQLHPFIAPICDATVTGDDDEVLMNLIIRVVGTKRARVDNFNRAT
jgi:hypothetical protein